MGQLAARNLAGQGFFVAALDKDDLWVFPGRGTNLGWLMRRWMPNTMWRQVHTTEGV